jgi:hypothetical protein
MSIRDRYVVAKCAFDRRWSADCDERLLTANADQAKYGTPTLEGVRFRSFNQATSSAVDVLANRLDSS